MHFSARTVGIIAAAVTVLIWTSFIIIARASAGHTLTPFDIALAPGLSALGAVLWLGEPLYWNLLAGLALVTAGILFGVRGALPAAAGTAAPAGRTTRIKA